MDTTFLKQELIRDLSSIDAEDILSEWEWLLEEKMELVLVSSIGDMFLKNTKGEIFLLDTLGGELKRVADSENDFAELLTHKEKQEELLSRTFVETLIESGKTLSPTEIYSFMVLPVLGGDFTPENIEPTDISVHFSMTGQIHKQVHDLPDGTEIDGVVLES